MITYTPAQPRNEPDILHVKQGLTMVVSPGIVSTDLGWNRGL